MNDDNGQTPDLGDRLDELLREVRRQGRAAVAAQAAAESCLERLDAEAEEAPPGGAAECETRWLRALLPMIDALYRTAAHAEIVLETPEPRWIERLFAARHSRAEARALADAVRVLKAQLSGVLQELGVTLEQPLGHTFDPESHRVVETRRARSGETPGSVVEVVRSGVRLGDRLLREADVVVTKQE